MMPRVFEPLLGKTVEVYIDDILVKSRSQKDHLAYLRKAFYLLQQQQLWLNPAIAQAINLTFVSNNEA